MRYIEILERLVNLESDIQRIEASRKTRYMEFLKDLPYSDQHKAAVVKDAMDAFEREDRIMWFLRKARASDMIEFYEMPQNQVEQYRQHLAGDLDKEKLKSKIEKIVQAPIDSAKAKERMEKIKEEGKKLEQSLSNIRHYIANARLHKLHDVLDYTFPPNASQTEVFEKLRSLEQAEMAKRPDDRFVKDNEGGAEKLFLSFPDGWKWVELQRSSCRREGKAMRNCGNTAHTKAGDVILSLREPVELEVTGRGGKKKKEKFWKPHLNFILNDGCIGEMKGFANERPSKELHQYIIKLLEDPRIECLVGGGYRPENNFSLKHLSPSQRKRLLNLKPHLDQEGKRNNEDEDDFEDENE